MRLRALFIVVYAATLLAGSAEAAAPSSATVTYRSIVRDYYNAQWKTHPVRATETGVHRYDADLDDVSPAAKSLEIARLKNTEAKLRAVDGAALSQMDRDDRDVLMAQIDGQLLEDENVQHWRHDPGSYVDLLTYAVFELIGRNFAPLPQRMKDVIARETAIPGMLTVARHNLTNMPPVFIDMALANLRGGISFLNRDVAKAFSSVRDPALQKQLTASTRLAVAAATDFEQWLIVQRPHAHGSFMLGRANLQRLLASDMVDVPVAKVLAAGEAQFARDHAAYLATEKLVDAKDPSHAMAEIAADHPAAAHLVSAAREQLVHLQRFIEQHHILTLPSQQLPVVAQTPPFARAVIFGQTNSPGPLERHATKVYYFITPPDPTWPQGRQEKLLSYFNRSFLTILSVHEALPGHFTQYLFAHANPEWPLARKMAHSYSTTEGWAHYSEQMMLDEGLGDRSPRLRLVQLGAALLRDCRLIAAIKMHTGEMTLAQATQMMEKKCFVSSAAAPGEAERGTSDPQYYSYTLGKLEILKLRSDLEKKEGKDFSLTKFHNAFLNAGLVPVAIIRREMGLSGPAL